MPDTIIVHAASGGHDTGASGCGPGDGYTSGTALTDVTESTTAEFTTATNLQIPNSSLTGVAAGHVVYVYGGALQTRKFFEITAVNNAGTATASVTVTPADGAAESGLNFSIGGKRASLFGIDSYALPSADALTGWVIEFESGYTESTSGRKTVLGGSGSGTAAFITYRTKAGYTTKATFTWTDNLDYVLGASSYRRFESIRFLNNNPTKTASSLLRMYSCNSQYFYRCEFGDKTNFFYSVGGTATPNSSRDLTFVECYFGGQKWRLRSYTGHTFNFIGCVWDSVAGPALDWYENIGRDAPAFMYRCLFVDCTGAACVSTSGGAQLMLIECTTHNSPVLYKSPYGYGIFNRPVMLNCVANDGIGVGLMDQVSAGELGVYAGNLAYNSNTTADSNPPSGPWNEAALTTDPFPSGNDASDDYTGEGNTQGVGYPSTDLGGGVGPGAGNRPYADIGAVTAQRSAGGGLIVHPGMSGGMRG